MVTDQQILSKILFDYGNFNGRPQMLFFGENKKYLVERDSISVVKKGGKCQNMANVFFYQKNKQKKTKGFFFATLHWKKTSIK